MMKKTMDGNEAAAYASYAFTEVAAIYPITNHAGQPAGFTCSLKLVACLLQLPASKENLILQYQTVQPVAFGKVTALHFVGRPILPIEREFGFVSIQQAIDANIINIAGKPFQPVVICCTY